MDARQKRRQQTRRVVLSLPNTGTMVVGHGCRATRLELRRVRSVRVVPTSPADKENETRRAERAPFPGRTA